MVVGVVVVAIENADCFRWGDFNMMPFVKFPLQSGDSFDNLTDSGLVDISLVSDSAFGFFEPIVRHIVPSSFCIQHAVDTERFDLDFFIFNFDGILLFIFL